MEAKIKTIMITGATSGFGLAAAKRFASSGWRVIASGRRKERLEDLAKGFNEASDNPVVLPLGLDVKDRRAIESLLADLPKDFAEIDVLLNNAGLALGLEAAPACDLDDWETMVDTNIKGVLYLTKMLLPGMVQRNRGHIINLGSIAGTYPYPGGNVYGATKAFVKQFSLNLRADLLGTGVRVTNIEPGMAESEFSLVRFHGDKERADKIYEGKQPITPEEIAEIVFWVTSLPSHININRLEVMPTCQAFGPLAVSSVNCGM